MLIRLQDSDVKEAVKMWMRNYKNFEFNDGDVELVEDDDGNSVWEFSVSLPDETSRRGLLG